MESILTRITDYVHRFAAERPDHEAVVFDDERISYRELERRVDACARALLAAGVRKGDRVAMLSTSRPEYWVVFLATAGVGAIWTGLNPRHRLEEFRYHVGDAKPKLIVAFTEFEGRSYADDLLSLRNEFGFVEQLVVFGGTIEGAVSLEDFLESGSLVSAEDYRAARNAVDRMDPALIVYTSGTTGNPKGAMLSHWGLCFGATMQTEHFKVEDPRIVVNFPIDHVACVADTCSTTLVKGGTIIFQERFDPEETVAAVAAERANVWGGIPTMLQLEMGLPNFEDYDLSAVEMVLWAGAALPRETIVRLKETGPRLMTAYGMTETSAHVTYSDDDADIDVLAETVGRPDPRTPCRIVDGDGKECPVGEDGELQFRGDYLMLGYYERPEATAESFTEDGWFHTGDVGYWREDGNIVLVGRMSEMFKSGGYNVYPREIELALEEHEGVAMAAVIAVPDDIYQEVGHAYVLREPGVEVSGGDLTAHCKGRLANYKVPKKITIQDTLPMLPVGKVDKKALKAQVTRAQ
jgi:acyl-CoA synthetase (AMP-forming)/AMP-acid ligase II